MDKEHSLHLLFAIYSVNIHEMNKIDEGILAIAENAVERVVPNCAQHQQTTPFSYQSSAHLLSRLPHPSAVKDAPDHIHQPHATERKNR